jgi:hypothetical protein
MVNGFGVSFDRTKIPYDGPHGPVRFANQYVTLEGTFHMENPGHWQGWFSSVDCVSALTDFGKQRECDARDALKSAACQPNGDSGR